MKTLIENKKGQFDPVSLTLYAIIGVIAIVLLAVFGIGLGALLVFLVSHIYIAIGAVIIVFSLIVGIQASKSSEITTVFSYVSMGIIVGILVMVLGTTGYLQSAFQGSSLPANARLAMPHQGAYFCTYSGSGTPTYSIPNTGVWVSKDSIGVYTNKISDIKVTVSQSYWDSYARSLLYGGARIHAKTCDQNKQNCLDTYQDLRFAGTTSLTNLQYSSFNPMTQSLFVVIETRNTILSSWTPNNLGATISFSYDKFGLKWVSTTYNPAGALIPGCEATCDLSCPKQDSRNLGLVYTTKNSLQPGESVPFLEYWEDLSPELNNQLGGTVYDSSSQTFCLSGNLYTSGTLTMDNGITYIYPNTATRRSVACCPGAKISTLQEDKICQADYTWKTVTSTTIVPCPGGSDYECFNAGQNTCQNKLLNGYHCVNKICVKGTNQPVQCCSNSDCPTDQSCQSNRCVGGYVAPPIANYNTTELNISQNKASCEASSSLGIKGQWVTTTTQSCGWNLLCQAGIGKPTITSSGVCQYPGRTAIILGALAIVAVIVIVFIATKNLRKPKKSRKK